jgi:hypothetical protein
MKYLLAGLGAYSIAVGSISFMEHNLPNTLLVGWGLGLILLVGSMALFLGGKK